MLSRPPEHQAMLAAALGGFICFALLYTTQPLLPQLALHFGVSPAKASLNVTAGTSAMALLLIPFALFADRYGREKMMRLGLVAAGIFSIFSALATDFTLLVLLRIGVGAAIAAYPSLAMGYLGDEIRAMCANALSMTQRSINGMRPKRSAAGMNRPGGMTLPFSPRRRSNNSKCGGAAC